jgi:hypothetical protein
MEISSILTSICGTLGNFRKGVKEANTLKLSTDTKAVDRIFRGISCRDNAPHGIGKDTSSVTRYHC